MITIKKRNAVPRAELTCRGCGSVLEYGNEDLVEFTTETAHYLIDSNGFLARNYKLKCPVCNIEQPAPWIQGQKTTSAPQIPSTNEELVDLGLPSGTLWSKFNLGAEKETDFGNFYQWGDIQGHEDSADYDFSWGTYKWGTENNLTKYGSTDNNLVLDNEDDPVYSATHGKMKSPTKEQWKELIANTNHQWIYNFKESGANGIKFTNKNDSTKYIFIPAAGFCSSSYRYRVNSWGFVWSSSRGPTSPDNAWYMYCYSGNVLMGNYHRCDGYSVRGVMNKKNS